MAINLAIFADFYNRQANNRKKKPGGLTGLEVFLLSGLKISFSINMQKGIDDKAVRINH
jgi:hypothetical protein